MLKDLENFLSVSRPSLEQLLRVFRALQTSSVLDVYLDIRTVTRELTVNSSD